MQFVNDLSRPYPAYPYFCGDVQHTLGLANFKIAKDVSTSVRATELENAGPDSYEQAMTFFYIE